MCPDHTNHRAPHFEAYGISHVGMKRSENQDSYLVSTDMGVFMVADGMGGHKGGQTASAMAVQSVYDYFHEMYSSGEIARTKPSEVIQNAILAANSAIQARGHEDASLAGMGTTTTLLHFSGNHLYIGHVGDSRGYLIHPNRIWQLTRDHSLVQEKLRAGIITRDQLKTDRMKNVITRSVGFEFDVNVDVYEIEPHPGDAFVICSDGLSGMVNDIDIQRIVQKHLFRECQIQIAGEKLIQAANQNGGDDNVTAILIHLH